MRLLTVEAAPSGRARVFHQPEFLEFTMVDGMAVAFFNRFTTSNNKE
ncbi:MULTISPECIES: hypothetical protein [unclassified Akkermansia]|jgi:hypothetical protein|nr:MULTISPECIES: hypothetical protein [unclassified Akkermansia]MBS6781633.1 hypothetical protein [Akkermansia sp.]MEE0763920.1 hypothetical protein [Akkermansia sp.]